MTMQNTEVTMGTEVEAEGVGEAEEAVDSEEIELEVDEEEEVEALIEEEEATKEKMVAKEVLWMQILKRRTEANIIRIITTRDMRERHIMVEHGIRITPLDGEETTMARRRAMEKVAGETRTTRKRRLRISLQRGLSSLLRSLELTRLRKSTSIMIIMDIMIMNIMRSIRKRLLLLRKRSTTRPMLS